MLIVNKTYPLYFYKSINQYQYITMLLLVLSSTALLLICSNYLALATSLSSSSKANFRVSIDSKDGSFGIYVNDKKWFSSGDYFVQKDSLRYSTADDSLQLVSASRKERGSDNMGDYYVTSLDYKLVGTSSSSSSPASNEVRFNIYEYDKENFIVFEQSFSNKFDGTSTSNSDSVISSFPSFQISDSDGPDGYAQFISWLYVNTLATTSSSSSSSSSASPSADRRKTLVAPGFDSPVFGLWDANTSLYGGIGGSGCSVIYDKEMSASVVISALTNVMTASHASLTPGTLSYGIMGNVTSIPENFSIKYLMKINAGGINSAMHSWGETMRKFYGKPSAQVSRVTKDDVSLKYIGFTTDNGAYYYYNTVPGMNYEETVLKIKEYSDSVSIPYKYILLDSWWYFKGTNGGVSQWAARPDVFPNGLAYLYNKTKWYVQAHNRYWAEDVVYAKENGGKYDFLLDHVKHGSVPTDDKFWDDLLSSSSSTPGGGDWGLKVYEQDWLHNEFNEYVGAMLETVDLGKTWLTQMSRGAEKNNLTIQYCMPFIRHMLQSLEFQTVTQIRASDDYVVSPYDGADNWRIAGQTILIDALGAAPSKDGFWTSHYQPGNPYGEERFEPYPRFQAAVATLSTGPIQIADGIGYSDVDLINKMIAKDGSLLQPSYPIKRIDAVMSADTFLADDSSSSSLLPRGEIWFSYSLLSDKAYMQVLVPELANEYVLKPSDIFIPTTKNDNDKRNELTVSNYWAFESNSTSKIMPFSQSSPISISPVHELSDFLLYSIVPILPSGWAFQGELNKFVGVSQSRFISLSSSTFSSSNSDDLLVTARIVSGETINVGFINPDGKVVSVTCSSNVDAIITISALKGTCTL